MSTRIVRDAEGSRLSKLKTPREDTLIVPVIDSSLVAYLHQSYPDRLPDPGTDPREVDFLIGQQSVIRHLADLHQQQKDEAF